MTADIIPFPTKNKNSQWSPVDQAINMLLDRQDGDAPFHTLYIIGAADGGKIEILTACNLDLTDEEVDTFNTVLLRVALTQDEKSHADNIK